MSDFELQLLHHASPALVGMKEANLFSLPLSCLSDIREEVSRYQKQLARKGISLEYLYCCQKRVFFLVYRQEALLAYLNQKSVRNFLIQEGYPEKIGTSSALPTTWAYLRKRIAKANEFPHEIGFFLGYPVADVFAFIAEKGRNYKVCGYWKVYHNEKDALALFQQYECCRKHMMEQAARGIPILSLLEAN